MFYRLGCVCVETWTWYVHPQDEKGAELVWVLPVAQLIGDPRASLLKVHVCREGDGELLLLYEVPNMQKTVLARAAWPGLSIREPPKAVSGSAEFHICKGLGRPTCLLRRQLELETDGRLFRY